MNAAARLRHAWATVRPRTRRGGLLAIVGILAGSGVLAAVLFIGAAMAWSPYLDYSLHRDVDARSWAALDVSFAASTTTCARCHAPEATKAASAAHSGIGCQSCHGPLAAHVAAGKDATSDSVPVAVPTDEVCVRCHTQAQGRPIGQHVIIPAQHYVSVCLQCHDPHTGIANRPPVVQHPLDNLPACLTCHGPEGFKARNQRHPSGTADDKPCLDCHAPGRGPDEDQVTP